MAPGTAEARERHAEASSKIALLHLRHYTPFFLLSILYAVLGDHHARGGR